jgi:hypothetical protein
VKQIAELKCGRFADIYKKKNQKANLMTLLEADSEVMLWALFPQINQSSWQ